MGFSCKMQCNLLFICCHLHDYMYFFIVWKQGEISTYTPLYRKTHKKYRLFCLCKGLREQAGTIFASINGCCQFYGSECIREGKN